MSDTSDTPPGDGDRLGVFLVVDSDGEPCRCLGKLHALMAEGLASYDATLLDDSASWMNCPRGPHRVVEYIPKTETPR